MLRVVFAVAVAGCSYTPSAVNVDDASQPDVGDAPADMKNDAPPDIATLTCPAGFAQLAGAPAMSRYRAGSAPETYDAAVAACAAVDPRVHLVRLDTRGELDAVFALTGALTRVVGQRHLNNPAFSSDDTWHDLDDVTQLTFLPWGMDEPTALAGEFCMTVREEFNVDPPPIVTGADNCTTARAFVCECE